MFNEQSALLLFLLILLLSATTSQRLFVVVLSSFCNLNFEVLPLKFELPLVLEAEDQKKILEDQNC